MKRFFSHLIRRKNEEKKNSFTSKEKAKGKDPLDLESSTQLLSQTSNKQFNFNELTIDPIIIKQGRFSQIFRGIYQNQSVALKIFQDNLTNQSIRSIFNHEKEIYLLPSMEHPNLLK